ncbi:hypothetical protein BC829DRAFT_442103 [Chytridium lagenaria]|nr:hypothetical protein BC829DRAFT_442103 [Chytridium lagenaria]
MHTQTARYRGTWHYPRGKGLKEKRIEVNEDGVRRVREAMTEEAMIDGKPAPTFDTNMFITWEEQHKMCLFYETKIVSYCKVFKFDNDGTVQATAITFFKRFYLNNTIMDYDPKLILLTCLFLAAKVENSHMPLTDFLAKVPRAPPAEMILELEFILCKGLGFHFMVQPLKWPLHGLFLDMQAYLLSKYTNAKSVELRDGLAKLANSYAAAIETGQKWLHTDLVFTHWPSQVAMSCFLLGSQKCGFRDEVERYITFRMAEELSGPGAPNWVKESGGFLAEEDGIGGSSGIQGQEESTSVSSDRMVQLKILLGEVEDVLSNAEAAVDKDEAKRIDTKLQGSRNPEFIKEGPLFLKRKREEQEHKESKRRKKVEKEREELSGFGQVLE